MLLDLIATTLQVATPIWLAALGGMYAQRAGVMHLGLEGLMLLGAFASTAILVNGGSLPVALLAAIAVDVAVSVLFWLLITYFGDHILIAGLALSITASGATTFGLVAIFGSPASITAGAGLPHPVQSAHGPLSVLNGLSILAYAAAAASVLSWWVLRRTRFGLRLHAAGDDPFAARSAGVRVERVRLHALAIAGVLCALAGADLALGAIQSFSEDMTAGRGYLAFAAVLLGRASPLGVTAAALFFGAAGALGIRSQLSGGHAIPVQFVLMLPYLLTVIAVSLNAYARHRHKTRAAGPSHDASLREEPQ